VEDLVSEKGQSEDLRRAPKGAPNGGQSGIERLAEKGQKRGQIWVFS